MKTNLGSASISASIAAYLEELAESGIDGLPGELTAPAPAAQAAGTVADVARPQPTHQALHPETLEHIRKALGDCQRCKLSTTRRNIVFGTGNPKARIVFVGEGPGADEDIQGEPFVGEAGQILNRIITAMGLKRDDVYICNVVKCRPPRNRDPEQDEISACSSFMLRQIQSINPEAIVALGKFAAQTLLDSKEPIFRLRGKFRDFHGIPLMPTFHPSYLLHNKGNTAPFWDVWEDMKQILCLLNLPIPEKNRK